MTESPRFQQDVVLRILPASPDKPIGVLFERHAAIYFLHREDPGFAAHLRLLEESRDQKTPVRFTFDVAGQRLTSVAKVT